MSAVDSPLLEKVYVVNGAVGYFGFNGGGPASAKQKSYLRSLIQKHAGDPTVEAIRDYMNELREDDPARLTRSEVVPAIGYLKSL
jgi:hypothetical protein